MYNMVIQVSLDVLCLHGKGGKLKGGRAWLSEGISCGGLFPKRKSRKSAERETDASVRKVRPVLILRIAPNGRQTGGREGGLQNDYLVRQNHTMKNSRRKHVEIYR